MSETTQSLTAAPLLEGIALPAIDQIARVSLADVSGRLVLRASAEASAGIGQAIGAPLDGPVNRAVTSDTCSILKLGPDEWLILADAERDPWLSARIGEAASGAPVSLVDVSHRSVSLCIDGPRVEDMLATGCPLPLDQVAFPVARATRTVLAKTEVVLWRRSRLRFQIEVAHSFAPYVVAYLASAIADEAAVLSTRSS